MPIDQSAQGEYDQDLRKLIKQLQQSMKELEDRSKFLEHRAEAAESQLVLQLTHQRQEFEGPLISSFKVAVLFCNQNDCCSLAGTAAPRI